MAVSAVARNDFRRVRVGQENRIKITELLKKHQYRPNILAQNLQKQETKLINLFIPSIRFFEVPFQQNMLMGMQDFLAEEGYRMSFYPFKLKQEMESLPQPEIVIFNSDTIALVAANILQQENIAIPAIYP